MPRQSGRKRRLIQSGRSRTFTTIPRGFVCGIQPRTFDRTKCLTGKPNSPFSTLASRCSCSRSRSPRPRLSLTTRSSLAVVSSLPQLSLVRPHAILAMLAPSFAWCLAFPHRACHPLRSRTAMLLLTCVLFDRHTSPSLPPLFPFTPSFWNPPIIKVPLRSFL